MNTIACGDFERVDLRVGRVVEASPLENARKPAFQMRIDFGADLGILVSSAQITAHYTPADLVGKLVVAVVNLPPKQIAAVRSECLVTGFPDENGNIVLCVPDHPVPPGARLA